MVGEIAAATPDLSTLLAAVTAANLTDALSSPGPVDVFAPTNGAFEALLETIGASAAELLQETALLDRVLKYHVVINGAVCEGALSGSVQTALPDESLTVDGSTVTDANGNTANIVGTVPAGNGVVYVIDSVLLPSPDSQPASAPVGQIACPPDGFDSVPADQISIPAYISKPWYIQQQIPVQYQTESQLYCVRAAYKQIEDDLFEVYNYANNDQVNGTPQVTGEGGFRLLGEIPDASDPAKLQVGIAGLGGRPSFAGPYWIVAIDTENIDDPQWAIVVGGPPDKESNGRCLYNIRGFNGNGFWLFTRDQVASPEMIQMMRDRAAELGLDVDSLLPVEQAGCNYDGAFTPGEQ